MVEAAPLLFERLVGWKELATGTEADGQDFAGFDAAVTDARIRNTPQASPTTKPISTAIYFSSQSTKAQTENARKMVQGRKLTLLSQVTQL